MHDLLLFSVNSFHCNFDIGPTGLFLICRDLSNHLNLIWNTENNILKTYNWDLLRMDVVPPNVDAMQVDFDMDVDQDCVI